MSLVTYTKLSFFFLAFLIVNLLNPRYRPPQSQSNLFLLMLAPAGDAKNIGRKIGDSFERGITLQYAEQLKKQIEEQCPSIKVIISRFPGDIILPLQNASFANRLQVDLFISIHFYQTTETKPLFYLYQFSYNDDFITLPSKLSFLTHDQAHLFNKKQTDLWAKHIKRTCKNEKYQTLFKVYNPQKLPFKPLIGILAPAIALEAGLKNATDWQQYIEPIMKSIMSVTAHLPQKK